MKKLDKARFYRNGFKAMKKAILDDITEALKTQKDYKLYLNNNRGSLCYNPIDDQESENIISVELLEYNQQPDVLVAWYGVYEEDNNIPLTELSAELLLNVMDAVEEAINDPE